ncbi:MAG: hypothetical protein ACE5Q6_03585 [Dehalococcoidia bacterium]
MLAVAALVADHEEPRALFLDCLATYLASPEKPRIDGILQDIAAHLGQQSKKVWRARVNAYNRRYKKLRKAIDSDPFVACDLYNQVMTPVGDWKAVNERLDAPEFWQAVKRISSLSYLNNSLAAVRAVCQWVGQLTQSNEEPPDEPDDLTLADLTKAICTSEKPSTNAGRKLAAFFHGELAKVTYEGNPAYISKSIHDLGRDARIWALIWVIFEGHGMAAFRAKPDLLADIKNPKDMLQRTRPFNQALGIEYPKGQPSDPKSLELRWTETHR